jgi:hypothetical protein
VSGPIVDRVEFHKKRIDGKGRKGLFQSGRCFKDKLQVVAAI